jgi:hypothetical protein
MSTEIVTSSQKLPFGPAMSALNDGQRTFVFCLNNAGNKNAAEAYRAAGYAETNARQHAYHMLHQPNIQAAIREDAVARFGGNVGLALNAIVEMAENPQHKDRLAASKTILNHAGLLERVVHENNVNVTLTFDQKAELVRQAEAVYKSLGGTVIEGEFTEVPAEPAPLW